MGNTKIPDLGQSRTVRSLFYMTKKEMLSCEKEHLLTNAYFQTFECRCQCIDVTAATEATPSW